MANKLTKEKIDLLIEQVFHENEDVLKSTKKDKTGQEKEYKILDRLFGAKFSVSLDVFDDEKAFKNELYNNMKYYLNLGKLGETYSTYDLAKTQADKEIMGTYEVEDIEAHKKLMKDINDAFKEWKKSNPRDTDKSSGNYRSVKDYNAFLKTKRNEITAEKTNNSEKDKFKYDDFDSFKQLKQQIDAAIKHNLKTNEIRKRVKFIDALDTIFRDNFNKQQLIDISKLQNTRSEQNTITDEDIYIAATLEGINPNLQNATRNFLQALKENEFLELLPKGRNDIKKRVERVLASIVPVADVPLPTDPFYIDDLGIQEPESGIASPVGSIPSYIKNFFDRSSITAGSDLNERLKQLSSFMSLLVDSSSEQNYDINKSFNNMVVAEYFYKIVLDLLEGTSKRLQSAGRKMEVFLALLLGGTSQVYYSEFDDLITKQQDEIKYVSVKLVSTSTMIYQAAATVVSYLKRNPKKDITYVTGVKDFTDNDFVTISLYKKVYTYKEIFKAIKERKQSNSDVIFAPADNLFAIAGDLNNRKHKAKEDGTRKYDIEFPKTKKVQNDKGTLVDDAQIYAKTTDHIIFTNFGDLIGEIKIPRDPKKFTESKSKYFKAINSRVDELYKFISQFKNASTEYFSESSPDNVVNALQKLNTLNTSARDIIKSPETTSSVSQVDTGSGEEQKNETKSLKELDKLIERVILNKMNKL